MFRSAFSGPITRWTIDQTQIRLDHSDWVERLDHERFEKTWYCPLTDSFLISVFHHTNSISGKDRRPAFRELSYFSDPKKIKEYITDKKIDRIVLLEDFVGTGTQVYNALKWAVTSINVPILFCPMIISREASLKFLELKSSLQDPSLFEIDPVLELDANCFVLSKEGASSNLYQNIRKLADKIHIALNHDAPKEGALGFWNNDSAEKGAMVVLFSNTPNSTVSFVHHHSRNWAPLFPRVTRSFL